MYSNSSNLEHATSMIVERASQLVQQLFAQRPHKAPPFLPQEFFSLLDIKDLIIKDLGDDISAVLLQMNVGQVIMVNQRHHLTRRNFSCAHELGHILFNELKLQQCIRNIEFRETSNPQSQDLARAGVKERLCDAAAAELLMPRSIFNEYLVRFGISVDSIEPLSKIFQVSNPTVAIRIAEVSPEPCVAFIWKLWVKRKTSILNLAPHRRGGICEPVHTEARRGSSLFKAFESNEAVNSRKLVRFKDNSLKRCYVESKGFGYGKTRYVVSMVFPGR